jgi:TPR repeat protein
MAAQRRHRRVRAASVCLLLAAWTAAATTANGAEPPEFPSPATTPVEQIRKQFEATAPKNAIADTLALVSRLHDPDGKAIVSVCAKSMDDLARAARRDPLSLAVWYYQGQCAEALGNSALRDRSDEAFAALVRDTLAGVPPDNGVTPLHVESIDDGNALIDASGEDVTYSYLDMSDLGRGLFWRAGLQDKQTHRERELSFEFLERRLALVRDPDLLVDPLMRLLAERDFAENGIDKSIAPWPGVPRTLDYLTRFTAEQEAARIKQLIASDSVDVPYVLAPYCFWHPEASCASAAVDKLLPLAERHLAQPMILLAYAEANGLGIKSDQSAAKVLLQGATRNEDAGAVYAAYLYLDGRHFEAASPFDRWIYAQVAAAADAGDKLAAGVALQFVVGNPTYEGDATRPKRWQQLADSAGLTDFSYAYCRSVAKAANDGPAEIACAQAAGASSAAAFFLADAYTYGDLPGVAVDYAKALYWRKQAAILGDAVSMRLMGKHYEAETGKPESLELAKKWYRSSIELRDGYAILDLAEFEARGQVDPAAGPKGAAKVYEAVSADPSKEFGPRARRDLALLLAKGKGIDRDPSRARSLVMHDADTGDARSQLLMANLLYAGLLGAPDPAGAHTWMEKAISANNTSVTIAIADQLYAGVKLPPDRARAIALWTQAAQQKGGELAWNDMAWSLCTAPDASLRNPKQGLDAAVKATARNSSPSWLDTLAACEAATGDYDAAAGTEQKALANADPDSDLGKNLSARIAQYRAHQIYVQPPYKSDLMQ